MPLQKHGPQNKRVGPMQYHKPLCFPKSLLAIKIAFISLGLTIFISSSTTIAKGGEKGSSCTVPKEGAIEKTYNQNPFEYQAKLVDEKDEYQVFRVTYPSPITTNYEPNNTVPADYFLPKGIKPGEKRPAVVCLHILNGKFELVNMVCSALAKRGVPAIMIKLPYYGERSIPGGFSSFRRQGDLFCQGLLQGFEDIRRTVDFLESRPEVDPKRIGVTGLSLGAIVSARVAADEPRFSKVVIVFGGGDLPYIIENAKETGTIKEYLAKLPEKERKEFEEKIRDIDPLTHAAKLKERAKAGMVWMYNGGVDETIPPRSARKLAAAMGMEDKIKWYKDVGHYSFFGVLPNMLSETVEFFADDVPPPTSKEVVKQEVKTLPADQLVSNWINQVNKLACIEPKSGCYHEVALEVQASPKGEKPWEGRLSFARGSNARFKLSIELIKPVAFKMSIGCDEFPWIASPEKGVVFCGTKGPDSQAVKTFTGPFDGVKPEYLKGLGMAKGVISVIAMSPSLLEQLTKIEEIPASDTEKDRRQIQIKPNRGIEGNLIFSCPKQAEAVDRFDFDVKGFNGNINFTQLCTDAPEEKSPFAPAEDLKHIDVERDSVYRTISGTINFLAEKVQ